MIDYKILSVDAATFVAQVRYSKENYPDYYVNIGLTDNFNEDDVHAAARLQVEQACDYWDRYDNANTSFTLSTDLGQAKDIIRESEPDYNFQTHYLEEVVEESNTSITYSFNVWEKSEAMIAKEVRDKRDDLLKLTDVWAYSDRTMSDAMTTYRQALRDIPDQNTFPTSVTWPVQPID
jgi:hypothetical protein